LKRPGRARIQAAEHPPAVVELHPVPA
jgi:hypothetical protein